MQENFIYVKMQDLIAEEVFHTVKLSQKQALGLGHSGFAGHATDQHGQVWKWDSQRNTHVLVKKDDSHETTGHESPLKPHIENQEKEIEKHVGALKQDIAEKKEEMTEKKSFSDKYVPFKKKEDVGEQSTKVYDKEDVKVGQHLVGTYGGASQVIYKVNKIEKSQNPQRDSDKIHVVNHRGENSIHSASDINRSHGPSIGIRTEALHEKHYNKIDAASRFESEAKYHKESTEATEKHTKIAEGNIGKDVVYHYPSDPAMHGKTGKIVGHKTNEYGTEYNVEVDGEVLGHHTSQNNFTGDKGWVERNMYDAKMGKGSFDKAKSEHIDKQENLNKPHETNIKEVVQANEGYAKYNTKMIGPKGNYGVKINDSGWATFAEIHSDIHNVGKRGKHVKVQTIRIHKPKDSNAAHELGLKNHLLKTNPQTHEDVVKEIHNYGKNQGSDRVSEIKVGNKEDVRGIDTNEDFGQIKHETINLGHTKIVPDKRVGKVHVIDLKQKPSEDGSGAQYSFPISHYSRLEGIKGDLSKTKSHEDVMKVLNDKRFKTSSFYYDPYR